MGESDGAVLALELFSAGAADHRERIAAPVEQNQRLLAAIKRLLGLRDECAGEELLLAGLLELTGACRSARPRAAGDSSRGRFISMRLYCGPCVRSSASFRAMVWPSPSPPPRLRAWRASRPRRGHCSGASLPACSSGRALRRRGSGRDCGAGAKTAERVPTIMGASPLWMRRHCSLRSSGVSAECSSATCAPKAESSKSSRLRRQADLRHEQNGRQTAIKRLLHRGEIDGGLS